MDKLNKYKIATWILMLVIILALLIVAGYFLLMDYKQKITDETVRYTAVYQTATKNILFWDGNQTIEARMCLDGFKDWREEICQNVE